LVENRLGDARDRQVAHRNPPLLLFIRLSDGHCRLETWVVDGPQQLARPDRDAFRRKIPAEAAPRLLCAVNATFELQHRAVPDIGQIEFLSGSSTGLAHIPTNWPRPTNGKRGYPTKPFYRADETVLKPSQVNTAPLVKKVCHYD
jgi:hypothetical protein